jgi:hypothetical protein
VDDVWIMDKERWLVKIRTSVWLCHQCVFQLSYCLNLPIIACNHRSLMEVVRGLHGPGDLRAGPGLVFATEKTGRADPPA